MRRVNYLINTLIRLWQNQRVSTLLPILLFIAGLFFSGCNFGFSDFWYDIITENPRNQQLGLWVNNLTMDTPLPIPACSRIRYQASSGKSDRLYLVYGDGKNLKTTTRVYETTLPVSDANAKGEPFLVRIPDPEILECPEIKNIP
jgi:hypothetical protein